jgi:hypothetical protein
VHLEGLFQFKNPMASSAIKPAIFQLVAAMLLHAPLKVVEEFIFPAVSA